MLKSKQTFLGHLQRGDKERELHEVRRKIDVTVVEKSELSTLKGNRKAYEKRGNILFLSDPKVLLTQKQDELSNLTKQKTKLEAELRT